MTKHSKNVEYSSVSSESNQMIELYEKAELLQEEGNSSKAISMLEEALEISLAIENWEYQFNCYYTIARSHLALGNFKDALNSIEGALNIAELHLSQNKEKLSLANNATGVIYYSQNNMELALDYFMKALQFKIEENKLKIYNNLGNTHSFSGNHEKAQEYYNLALLEAQDKEDDYMTATLLLNTSKSLAHYNQFDKAKENNQNALTLTDKHLESDQRFFYLKFYILLNLVEIYISEGDFDRATKTTDEVILTAKSGPLHECYCRALYHKASIFLQNDQEKEALSYVHQTLDYAREHRLYREKRDMLERIIEYYEQEEKLDKAYPFLKELHDDSQEEAKFNRRQNFERIIANREREIETLENQNKDIKDQNLLLEQFAHIISHDLKEPIRNIVSFSSLVNKRYYELLDNDGKEFLKYIIKGATTMNLNLTRLLDFTTLKIVPNEEIQKIEFSTIVENVKEYYKEAIEPFEINITCPEGHFNMVYSHAYALLDEIVSNAIKFRKRGTNCYIEISQFTEAGHQHILIKDYGIGIEPEFKKRIFKIFNRLNKKEYAGSGVGLAICERIIQLYRGEIWIESTPSVHTTIHIKLPVNTNSNSSNL